MNSELSVTVIGEALVDIISDARSVEGQWHPGGSPLNVAVGTARLALPSTLVTHFANDAHGEIVRKHLHANGVGVVRGGSAPTSTATATLSADGAATYVFNISWDLDGISATAAISSTTHLHTGSLATALAPGNQATLEFMEAGRPHATVSFDPNCRPGIGPDPVEARAIAERFVAASDIVKASHEDLLWLYPQRSPETSMQAWLDLGPALIALTRGEDGTVVATQTDRVEVPADRVVVADTVGAGDSFMSALISGLSHLQALGAHGRKRLQALERDDLLALAGYATRAAGITCSRAGANPPTAEELGKFPRAGAA